MSRLISVQGLNLDSNRTILQWHQRNRRLKLVVTDEMPSSGGPRVKHKLRAQHFNTGITSCNQQGIVRQVWRHKSYIVWTECTGCVVYQMKQPNPRKSPCNVLIDKYLLLHTLFPPLCKGFWDLLGAINPELIKKLLCWHFQESIQRTELVNRKSQVWWCPLHICVWVVVGGN